MPVSYWERRPVTVVCLTSATWSRWWRNLDGASVVVWLRGTRRNGRAELVDDQRLKLELVSGFLRHNVDDAHHYGVVLDDTGRPTEASLAALAGSLDTKVITINVEP
jgi:hypothetical protein